jgi:hypothetical protein
MRRATGSAESLWNTYLPQAALMCLTLCAVVISAQGISVRSWFQKGDFKLVSNGQAADILVSPDDHKVVRIAAGDLASDVERVTGLKPKIVNDTDAPLSNVVMIGTLGNSPFVDGLAKSGKLNVSPIRGKWESFLIATVKNPLRNIESALVIVGSDRRGTAFGVYELSQMIGVSPWHWWADVTPERKSSLVISQGKRIGNEPSVKYRGIFLNDEDWGLHPWAAKTFEPEMGDIGPKTYAKVFELLLRLKANTLWPAMHEVTKPFNANQANRQVANDYAMVMGSSHAEPMLRNNVGEWKGNKDDYNFVTNPQGVTDYWDHRVRENGKFENVYTVGMRGIHDSPILGTKSQAERIPLLEKIFSVQRGLLGKYVRPELENIPQIFCPYKEVLADYRAGLKVPDDVTIVFPDDNFGYIRQFPNSEERKRKGGFGVYYHISYLGRPLSYLWLNSTPPALIFEEMSKAYANGMRQLWIVNVGDIKPGEIGMEFFLQMAYDAKKWTVGNIDQYLKTWASREFGERDSAEIASIMDIYYRLGFQRKPEHLQWYLPGETPQPSDLNEAETRKRLDDYNAIRKQAENVYSRLSADKKAGFYELVLYPVRSAALANERFFAAETAFCHRSEGRGDSMVWAESSLAADTAIAAETKYFNETHANGKWRYIMSPEMNPGQWPSMRSTVPKISLFDFEPSKDAMQHQPVNRPLPTTAGNLISVEAEHFTRQIDRGGFGWRVIQGLGKTGDSVSVFPNIAKTFANLPTGSPYLEYSVNVSEPAEFTADLYLLPTQPLIAGNGLRISYGVDGEEPKVIVVDREAEVSSPKWARNILNETTIGTAKIHLTKGRHVLRILAVDTGVVLDKIVLYSTEPQRSYFGPPETRIL